MQLGSESFTQMFAFAEIGIDGMFGLDFLKDYDCSLDMASSSLKIKGKRYGLHMEGRISCCRVTLANNFVYYEVVRLLQRATL